MPLGKNSGEDENLILIQGSRKQEAMRIIALATWFKRFDATLTSVS
jgi:hypothetical protein